MRLLNVIYKDLIHEKNFDGILSGRIGGHSTGTVWLRAGFNSANFSDTDFDAKSGFHLGAYYTIGSGFLAFEPGLQYSKKGIREQKPAPEGPWMKSWDTSISRSWLD